MGKSKNKTSKSRTPAPAPLAAKKVVEKKVVNPLFEKRPKNFGIGQDILPQNVDLGRFVRWPKYVRIQRQRKILLMRLKVPPSVNQFRLPMDAPTTRALFKLMSKYKPETDLQKKERLATVAQVKKSGGDATSTKKPIYLKSGINHVTELVESKKASLVIIAHDVDPLELVVWLPALCKKMDVPYCIVKCSARLGAAVNRKTATAVAFDTIRPEDKAEFTKIVESVNSSFADRYEDVRKRWGGGIMGSKSQHKTEKRRKAIAAEEAKRIGT